MSRTRQTIGVFLICLFAAPSASAQLVESGCISCHKQADFYTRNPKLYAYYQLYLDSPHQQAGVLCSACHGGNESSHSAQEAHVGVTPMSDDDSTINYQEQPETCGQCHENERAQFIQSKHYAALMERPVAPTCTTCHSAMGGRPELRSIVLNACRNCHGEGNSENLPQIADRAEDVFNKLNMVGGLMGWTKYYYESNELSDSDQAYVRGLEKNYLDVLSLVHRFDIAQTEDAVTGLFDKLREDFERAQLDLERQAD